MLSVLDRNEDHRIAVRRHHATGQPHHGVVVATNGDSVAYREARLHVGHRFVVSLGDGSPGDQKGRATRPSALVARDHHTHVLAAAADLHREIGHVAGLRHARQAFDASIGVVGQAGGLCEGPQGVLLHHPDVRSTGAQEHLGVVDHAPVHARHGQGDSDQ